MDSYFQILALVIIGAALLFFGYAFVFGSGIRGPVAGPGHGSKKTNKSKEGDTEGKAGMSRACPVCSARLPNGEKVKSVAFPAKGKADRLIYIEGCPYCLGGGRPRVCPVCGARLGPGENLVARLFDKPGRSHVHVLGCARCRGPQR